MHSGCATALVLNKWDLADDFDLDHERARAHQKLRLRPRVLTASAKTGRTSSGCSSRRSPSPTAAARIPTPQLNRFLSDAVGERQPPAGGRAARPPATAAVHDPDRRAPAALLDPGQLARRVTRDYAYYLENRLRERFRLEGVPLIIDFVERSERRGARGRAA